jgi:type II secretory pathway component PulC
VTHCSYPTYFYNLSLQQGKALALEVNSTSIAQPNKVLVYWASISMENSIDCRNGGF